MDKYIVAGFVTGLLTFVILDILKVLFRRTRDQLRASDMVSTELRERWEKKFLAYELCKILEEMYFQKQISKERKEYWYREFGTKCDLLDLLPRMAESFPASEEVKELLLASSDQEKLPLKGRRSARELFSFTRRSKAKEV